MCWFDFGSFFLFCAFFTAAPFIVRPTNVSMKPPSSFSISFRLYYCFIALSESPFHSVRIFLTRLPLTKLFSSHFGLSLFSLISRGRNGSKIEA